MNVKHTPPCDMKNRTLRFRVTQSEQDKIMKHVRCNGYTSFSEYARDLIFNDMFRDADEQSHNMHISEAISNPYNK